MMSSLKRPRVTDWGHENVDRPRDKRMGYELDHHGYDYGKQNSWQPWPEIHETAYDTQASFPSILPAIKHRSDDSVLSAQGLSQGPQYFDSGLYQSNNQMAFLDSQESGPSFSAEDSQNSFIFGGDLSTISGTDVPVVSPIKTSCASPKTIYICYGSICDAKVQIDDELYLEYLHSSHKNVTEPTKFIFLKVLFEENHCVLRTSEGSKFGVLNNRGFRCLTKLHGFKDLEYTPLIASNDWKEKIFQVGKDSKRRCISLDINISGPRCQLDTTARQLSQAGLFLQPPHHGTTSLPYENPQYLHLPGLIQVIELPATFKSQSISTVNYGVLDDKQVLAWNTAYPDFDKLLEELPRHDYLKEAVVDVRLVTTLLSHQREAVDWIFRRETLNSPVSRSLWELENSKKDFKCYQHIITGAKSPTPNDFLGGILADDMGLGKSLAMLCAVMGSLDRANEYAEQIYSFESPREGRRAAKSTLIIVPSALLLDSWIEEIDKFEFPGNRYLSRLLADFCRHVFRGTLRYIKYHGQDRPKDPSFLARYEVVLTTYGTVVADFNRSHKILESIEWYRIIADEGTFTSGDEILMAKMQRVTFSPAHIIRNLSTKQFRAVNRIPSHIRWCLTGTPIQNSLTDLAALVSFLGVPILKEPAIFRKHIDSATHPSKANAEVDFQNLRLLLGSICLRRPKDILCLFGLTVQERRPKFSAVERQEYNDLLCEGRVALDLALSGHNSKETHQRVIEALLRLRLYCNNGLSPRKDSPSSASLDSEDVLSFLQQSGEIICKYCSCDILSLDVVENLDFVHMTECRLLICGECIPQYQQELKRCRKNGEQLCPFCSGKYCKDNLFRKENKVRESELAVRKVYPSKLLALLDDIQRNPLHEKSIVFSFWKKSLDLIEDLLKANGIRYCRVDGSLSLGKRKTVLAEFQVNPEVEVLIMTLSTGAVGLNNLSIASRIYLLEPQWNPSVESQAIGRIFRLGQERPVTVIRYIMDKSIEENVKNKQLRKLDLACGGFDKKTSVQRIEQLQQLKSIILDC